jgi:hypothetical protein
VGVLQQYADIEFADAFPHPRASRATSPASAGLSGENHA